MDDKPTRRTQRKSQRDYSMNKGGPTLYANTMKPTAIYLPVPMLTWLKGQDITLSAYVRELVQREMNKEG